MYSIFLFAHQDDEYGVYHSLLNKINKSNDNVLCLYLTNGGNASKYRNKESLRVLSKLGLEKKQVFFLGDELKIEDGKLIYNLSLAFERVLKIFKSLNNIDKIYVPAWEGGHPDHDASHVIGLTASKIIGIEKRVRQFSLYNGYKIAYPFFRVMYPLKKNGKIYVKTIPLLQSFKLLILIFNYKSQLKTWIGLFPFVLFSYLFIKKEYLQGVNLNRIYEKPHNHKLYYEHRKFADWNEVNNLINSFLKLIKL